MEIDWNKGPEGAIGFAEGLRPGHDTIWYRQKPNGDLEYCTDDHHDVWMESFLMPENVVWRKAEVSSWNGEGLPPVVTECEAKNALSGEWIRVKVIDHQGSTQSAVCREIGTDKLWWSDSFRPIRTPEQIEENEREARVEALREIIKRVERAGGDPAIAIEASGYRITTAQ